MANCPCGVRSIRLRDHRCIYSMRSKLAKIVDIIEAVDRRCFEVDGPVTSTLREMTPKELSKIYRLAKSGGGFE